MFGVLVKAVEQEYIHDASLKVILILYGEPVLRFFWWMGDGASFVYVGSQNGFAAPNMHDCRILQDVERRKIYDTFGTDLGGAWWSCLLTVSLPYSSKPPP